MKKRYPKTRKNPRRVMRRAYKRRTNRTIRRYNKPYTKIARMPVAEKFFAKLRYSDMLSITTPAIANTPTGYVFQTSLFDPDLTGVGHQPMWRDQMATLYNRYRVHGLSYKLSFKNTQTSLMAWAFVKHSNSPTLETSSYTIRERGEGKGTMLDALNSRANYINGYMSTGKPHGLTKRDFKQDDSFFGFITANPTKLSYLHIYLNSALASTVINVQVDLIYYAEFLDRIDVTSS